MPVLRVLAALLLSGALVALATWWRAGVREAATEADFPPEGSLLKVDGVQVHAVVRGRAQGEAPDLVLIHGSSGNWRDMTFRLSPALEDRYRVIIIDRPGLGWTGTITDAGDTIAAQAALLQAAAAHLGADRPLVMGQSLGGAVALAWAVELPETLSGLVLVGAPSYRWEGGLSRYYKVLSAPVLGPAMAALIAAWVPKSYVKSEIESIFAPQPAPEGYADRIGAGLTLRRASLVANARQRAVLKPQVAAMSEHYDRISVPVEAVHGGADDTVYPDIHSERLAAEHPERVNLTLLPGIGHMPHQVATAEVVRAIDRAAARAGLR